MKKFRVNDQCINCKACIRVAGDNFEIAGKKAVVFKQPVNDIEEKQCFEALEACPTEAIEVRGDRLVVGKSRVVEVLSEHPFLKTELLKLSPRFKNMQNPVMWRSVARYATFEHASRMTGVGLCEILHFINSRLGLEKELFESFPQCIVAIKDLEKVHLPVEMTPENLLTVDSEEELEPVLGIIEGLKAGDHLKIKGKIPLEPLRDFARDQGLEAVVQPGAGALEVLVISKASSSGGRVLDVRTMTQDPFDVIIQEAYGLKPGESFTLVQTFKPDPLINMLEAMGFVHQVAQEAPGETRILFTKTVKAGEEENRGDLPGLTIQSATPVAYPILMKLLQSERLKSVINIRELKVWHETEKHLAWIVNGRADISFSSVITASKFVGMPVKMPLVFVWDNFVLLSRNPRVKSLEDLKGKPISVPLFEDAPPAKITRYLLEGGGLDAKEFNLVFGQPFGRPETIMKDFITGRAEHVLLREPEAGLATAALEKRGIPFSEISYGDLWNELNPGFGSFPNAGVIVKESLYQTHPEVMAIFTEELEAAIDWVNAHHVEAAKLSFDMMHSSVDSVAHFLDRVTFKMVKGEPLKEKIRDFYRILKDQGILNVEVTEELVDLFDQD